VLIEINRVLRFLNYKIIWQTQGNQMEGIAMSFRSTLLGIGSAVATLAVVGVMIGGTVSTATAKAEYAQKTGKACGACHTNPAGGGKLTAAGEKYKASPK
jgi:hypothetical protein